MTATRSSLSGFGLPSFTVAVQEMILGENSSEVAVQSFLLNPCARRYAPYVEGQRAIFFLQYQRGDDGQPLVDQPLRVMGPGNDGECPVVDGKVLHNDFMLQGLPTARMNAFGHQYAGVAIPRDEYVSAVKGLRNCFSWPSEATGKTLPMSQRKLRQLCSDANLNRFRRSSPFAEAMVRDSAAYSKVVENKR